MALLDCPECANPVSDKAPSCPRCGVPMPGASQVAATPPISRGLAKSASKVVGRKGRGLDSTRMRKMNRAEQVEFKEEFARRKKSVLVGYICWFFLGWHYAHVGKWGIQFLFWLTAGGFLAWWIIDFFREPGIVRRYNDEVRDKISLQIAAMRGGAGEPVA